MAYEVVTLTAQPRPTAVVAATTTWPEYPRLWGRLLDQVHANVHWGGSGHKGRNVMLYLDDVPHVEVGVELDQPASFEPPVLRSALPAGAAVMTVHRGPFTELGGGHDAIHRWCKENGRKLAGPRWEIYGHHYDDPALLETEIYYLLADSR